MPKATWLTPTASLKNREEVWSRIENNGWKTIEMSLDPQITYFNNHQKHSRMLEYDHYFAFTKTFPIWDPKKPKDNTRYLPNIRENIFQQEKNKPVPALTSLTYGRPTLSTYDEVETAFKRSCATADFYRKKGVLQVEAKEEKQENP
ncbi:uncharacterized protein LOC109540480 [Dendroctonus ponderosae]|uniref:Uncharacterized protein n=1 Tax=Dendroctonus ponderosae TaxID=77166 RepID=A0AAR5PTW4_DENPD|nr:uncharacterized protein LOC109540480 [Dendroctonus ponderosae]KAH1007532.1 hypothetical protein HUJ04_004753 [Dendroctonus ponderosae]KAH1015036.1 hypothetical protein HUJ05_012818 [Dendroctonus ponderosae]